MFWNLSLYLLIIVIMVYSLHIFFIQKIDIVKRKFIIKNKKQIFEVKSWWKIIPYNYPKIWFSLNIVINVGIAICLFKIVMISKSTIINCILLYIIYKELLNILKSYRKMKKILDQTPAEYQLNIEENVYYMTIEYKGKEYTNIVPEVVWTYYKEGQLIDEVKVIYRRFSNKPVFKYIG